MGSLRPASGDLLAKYAKGILFVLIAWYLLLSLAHYLNGRPLWLDERVVFESVKAYTAKDIFSQPLLVSQVFPRCYLFLVQKLSQQFNHSLLSLRFLSCVFMLGAFYVWLCLGRRILTGKGELLLFILCWGASVKLIYYAAELKPYSMDVLAVALMILYLHDFKQMIDQNKVKLNYLILFFLPALCLFSYATYILLPIVLYNLLRASFDKKIPVRAVGVFIFSLAVFAGISFTFDIRLTDSTPYLSVLKDYFISFASAGDFFESWTEGTMNLFRRWLVEDPKILRKFATIFLMFGFVYMFYGFFKNIRKEKFYLCSLETMGLVIYGELFVLGALKKYPFTIPRTSLFFCPVVLYMTIKGISLLKQWNPSAHRIMVSLFVLFLCFISVGIAQFVFAGDLGAMPALWQN